MGFDPRADERQKTETRQRIIETGFRIFSENTIDAVNLTEVAEAAGLGMATVYRHFGGKTPLVVAIGAWSWDSYLREYLQKQKEQGMTGAEDYEFFLDSFIDLYENHRDILRFNQFFNIYVMREGILGKDDFAPYRKVLLVLSERFHQTYDMGRKDGTLKTEVPEKKMFLRSLHLMLAVITRYAVGLVYEGDEDLREEILFLKDMLLKEFVRTRSEE